MDKLVDKKDFNGSLEKIKPIGEENQIQKIELNKKNIKWGWMILLFIAFLVVSPIFGLYAILASWNYAIIYNIFTLYPKYYYVVLINISITLFLIFFGIYAGLSLYLLKERAVFKAKLYLIVGLIFGLSVPFLLLFVGFSDEALSFYRVTTHIGISIFFSLITFGVWFWFLTYSKTVKRIYFQNK